MGKLYDNLTYKCLNRVCEYQVEDEKVFEQWKRDKIYYLSNCINGAGYYLNCMKRKQFEESLEYEVITDG